MTQEQNEKIRELRLEGLGYKAIANVLGLSRDAVRGFCKRHELTGNATVVALNMQVKKQKNVVCLHCEKPLKHKAKGRTRKFCSDPCRRKWW
ncbi:GcrA family cell cycle regulator, partial [Zhenhengia yiwuensis]|uniref:GcrA family cell cycle regulator n=1 Tax=Zhenhengia yiwuensis TaxID=2763666 RepID=UPI002A7646DF